jgi:hypothetical protein
MTSHGLCKYKNIFGEPNKGFHSYRISIINLAVVDVLATTIATYAIQQYIFPTYSFGFILIIMFIIGIISHKVFCVDTQLNKYIFNKKKYQ